VSDKNNIVLAIESAITGGSLSLLRDGNHISGWVGSSDVSKAEDLLRTVDKLLTENEISKSALGLIAVSAGPGSFTGIRIGIATALGLKAGLGIEMSSESALKAMASAFPSDGKRLIVAVPVGRDTICLQSFNKVGKTLNELDTPHTLRQEDLFAIISDDTDTQYILTPLLAQKSPSFNVFDFGPNIASAIGRICCTAPAKLVEPLFVSKGF
jgi:tRNA threonylcarbamoyl adenosine modification protein YeaZ